MQTTMILDWTSIINTFIGTLPMLISALIGGFAVLRQIGVIHRATNSMKDALVAATEKASLAEGIAKGVVQEQQRAQQQQQQQQPPC
jgi:uncharacterized membrane-anchored protein YitT (DUF2179 family)